MTDPNDITSARPLRGTALNGIQAGDHFEGGTMFVFNVELGEENRDFLTEDRVNTSTGGSTHQEVIG